MSSTRALPFLKSPKLEIVAIGNDEIGIVHLLKKGGVSPNEKPPELQILKDRSFEVNWLMLSAAKQLAEKENISTADARKKIFGGADVKEGETEVVNDGMTLYDYVTKEQAELIMNQGDSSFQIAIATATLLIQHRVAYPVRLATAANSGAKSLTIDTLGFPLPAHSELKFGHIRVLTTEAQEPGSDEQQAIAIESLSSKLAAGKIGYLVDPETNKEMLGDPEWTKDDTKSVLTEELIKALHEFYELESQGIRELPEDEADEKKLRSNSISSSPTSAENLPIGQISSGESSLSESQMNGSTTKTLATSLSG